jgi:hypothetical protein
MNPLETKPFGEGRGMSRVIAQREVLCRLKLTISDPPKSDHAEAVELLAGADKSEPLAEDSGMNEKHCLALSAFCEFDFDVVDADALPRCKSIGHVRTFFRAEHHRSEHSTAGDVCGRLIA